MKIFARGIAEPKAKAKLRYLTAADELWIAESEKFTTADRAFLAEAEVFLGTCPPGLLASAPRLRWVQFMSVGLDAYPAAVWSSVGGHVTCTHLRGVFAEAMAQTVLAGILGFERGLDEAMRLQSRKDWQKARLHARSRVLQGAQVLLLGGGSVGSRVRELLGMFGCTFTTFARTSGDISTREQLDAALPGADIVCASLPETPGTRGLMDARRISLLKRGALFVNVGRGSLVDEPALMTALQAGQLRGALIDVTCQEPLSAHDPWWTCPRVWLTQHSAAGSSDEYSAAVEFFGINLRRFRRGEPLANVVDWSKGY